MPTVFDVAEYILRARGPTGGMKLQKLVYYSQAWSLVWEDAALFDEPIEAWTNGPVVPALYDRHRGEFSVATVHGNPDALNPEQRDTIDRVLAFYGPKSSQWLSDLTHREYPWIRARRGLAPAARGNGLITLASMAEYYSSLQAT